MKRMLDIKELAMRIGLRPQTIRNKLNCGTLPIKTKKIGRKLLWDIAEVDRFLDGLKPIN
jgi:predicted DNA-binding transcriptional regulator AlpA